MFNSGDKVICLESGLSQLIKKGKVYTVHSMYKGGYVKLQEIMELDSRHNYCVNNFKRINILPEDLFNV